MYESNLKGWSRQSTNGHLYKQTCSSSCIRKLRDATAVHTRFDLITKLRFSFHPVSQALFFSRKAAKVHSEVGRPINSSTPLQSKWLRGGRAYKWPNFYCSRLCSFPTSFTCSPPAFSTVSPQLISLVSTATSVWLIYRVNWIGRREQNAKSHPCSAATFPCAVAPPSAATLCHVPS